MNRKKENLFVYSLIITVVFIAFILIISGEEENTYNNQIDENSLLLKAFGIGESNIVENDDLYIEIIDEGYDIYVPSGKGYRYGPSIIYYEDGSMDAWFASNGNSGSEWDWITYRHFDGEDWSSEKVVLRPSVGTKDHYSVCDPGVIYFDGYYYLGYTSTENATYGGVENNIYVARSENPDGPFEKWNGEGWGGNPMPIVSYLDADLNWGAGEISFVIVHDKLYCYYTWINEEGSFTKLSTAPLEENWPANLKGKGNVIYKVNGQGSVDVAYNDEFEKFIAVCTEYSFQEISTLAVYESDDGKTFIQVDALEGIEEYAHNLGISKKPDGHIDVDDELIIGYAYSKQAGDPWGKWSTKIQSVRLYK